MANVGLVRTLLASLDSEVRKILVAVFEYVMGNLSIGPIDLQKRAENFQWYPKQFTTPGTANQEFTVVHGLGRKPRLILPVLPLDAVAAKLVRLEVSKDADEVRVYLKSPDTNATMFVLVE